MKAPLSWLRSFVALSAEITAHQIADALTRHVAAVEKIEPVTEVTGPVVVGRVLSFVDEPQKNGKTIRWCRVDVGPDHNEPARRGLDGVEVPSSRGIVCGANNFVEGDLVVVALPGAQLPGGFAISARKTYGHISDGMICAEDELGIGEDHEGILVLPEDIDGCAVVPGNDALDVLGVRDDVLEIDVTPDIGYCLSMRGLAREIGQIFDIEFSDPYPPERSENNQEGYPIRIEDERGCPLFVAVSVNGVDPNAATPRWMMNRLRAAGMRPISLSVDVTNYVMLESGQPLHAYDADALCGPIVVRSAHPGEKLTTIDHVKRELRDDDLLICDDSGPIGIAGVMGGLATEIGPTTTNVVLEAAHFDPRRIARSFRAHNLGSEASRRFEKGVDPALPYAAARRAAELLVEYGGGEITAVNSVGGVRQPSSLDFDLTLPTRILGIEISAERVVEVLRASGVTVVEQEGNRATLTPPTWRFDLVDPHDYVEDVARKIGFDELPLILPSAPAGRGLTRAQSLRRMLVNAAVNAGFVEVISLPFVSEESAGVLGFVTDELVRVANPLDDTSGFMRPSLLPGLFAAVSRNVSRGLEDLALFEMGAVFRGGRLPAAPQPSVEQRPSDDELAAFEASLPEQPRMLAAIATGNWVNPGWQDEGVRVSWVQVVALAEALAAAVGVTMIRQPAQPSGWHPGRCAALFVNGEQIGYAGELHPTTIKHFSLPEGAVAIEVNIDRLIELAPELGRITHLSTFPLVKQDVALIVPEETPVDEVSRTLVEGAGDLLESISLFDVYTGPQIGEGKKSLAFNLRFRAPERTLKEVEAGAARDAAVTLAAERFGAVQRA